MSWKELMASQGKVSEWLRVIIATIIVTSTGVAAFTSWQARQSFDELRQSVREASDRQEKFNAKVDAALNLHEQRLTSIEANRFSRIDGERLQLQISDNVKSIAIIQTDLAYIKNSVSSSGEKIDRLLERRP